MKAVEDDCDLPEDSIVAGDLELEETGDLDGVEEETDDMEEQFLRVNPSRQARGQTLQEAEDEDPINALLWNHLGSWK